MTTRLVISILLLLVSNLGIAKDLFIWVDESGVKHYSQTPPDKDVGQSVEKREIKTPKDNLDPADYDYEGTVDQWGRTNTELNNTDIIKIEKHCRKTTVSKEAYENCVFYTKADYKVRKSKLKKHEMTTPKKNSNCIAVSPDWDVAGSRTINDNYESGIDRCKQNFTNGSYQFKNCIEEQEDIKEKAMANYNDIQSKRCKP